jgi:hypothetical protein
MARVPSTQTGADMSLNTVVTAFAASWGGVEPVRGDRPREVVLPEPSVSWINPPSQRHQGPEQRSRTLLKLP